MISHDIYPTANLMSNNKMVIIPTEFVHGLSGNTCSDAVNLCSHKRIGLFLSISRISDEKIFHEEILFTATDSTEVASNLYTAMN